MYTHTNIKVGGKFKSVAGYTKYQVEQIVKKMKYYDGQLEVHGKLAAAFGLKEGQKITEKELTDLISGKHITSGKQLTSGRTRVKAIDLTMAPPKSVSIEAEVNGNEEVRKICYEATTELLAEFEEERIGTRTRVDGKITPQHTGKLAACLSIHNTTRENDPHLHTHVIIPNITKAKDGRLLSLDGKRFHKTGFQEYMGNRYKLKVAEKLKAAGYSLSYSPTQKFRMDKVSIEEEELFSKRHFDIQKRKAKDNLSEFEAWAKTRPDKLSEPEKEKIRKESQTKKPEELAEKYNVSENIISNILSNKSQTEIWKAEQSKLNGKFMVADENRNRRKAAEKISAWCGKTKDENGYAIKTEHAKYSVEAQQESKHDRANISDTQRWQLALERATESSSTTTEEKLFAEFSTELLRSGNFRSYSEEEFRELLAAEVAAGNITELTKENSAAIKYTSISMKVMTKNNIERLRDRAWTPTNNIEEIYPEWEEAKQAEIKYLKKTLGDAYNEEHIPDKDQAAAIKKILSSDSAIDIVQGKAGSGKTTMMSAFKEIAAGEGIKVIGISQNSQAAKNLEEETGIKSMTMAQFLYAEEKNESKNNSEERRIIILDEANMVGTRDMDRLCKIRENTGDKLLPIGDHAQLSSIAAGTPFKNWVDEIDKDEDRELIVLNKNHRQKDPVLKGGADLCRNGKVPEGIEFLDQFHNPIREIMDRHERLAEAIKLYYEYLQQNQELKILAGARADRDELNKMILLEEVARENVDKKELKKIETAKEDYEGREQKGEMFIAKGVKILCTKPNRKLGIQNGLEGEIIEHNPEKNNITIETDQGNTKQINLSEYNYLDYGYAQTTFSSEGHSYDNVAIVNDTSKTPLGTARNQYVNLTRAKYNVYIITDDKEQLIENANRDYDDMSPLTGSEDLEDLKKQEYKLNQRIKQANIVADPNKHLVDNQPLKEEISSDMEKINRTDLEIETSEALYKCGSIKEEDKKEVAAFLSSDKSEDIWKYESIEPVSRIIMARAKMAGDEKALEDLPEKDKKIGRTIFAGPSKSRGSSLVRE